MLATLRLLKHCPETKLSNIYQSTIHILQNILCTHRRIPAELRVMCSSISPSLFQCGCACVVQKKLQLNFSAFVRQSEDLFAFWGRFCAVPKPNTFLLDWKDFGLYFGFCLFVCLFFRTPHYLFSFQFCNFKSFSIDFLARMNTFSADSNCFGCGRGCEMWAI